MEQDLIAFIKISPKRIQLTVEGPNGTDIPKQLMISNDVEAAEF